MANYTQQTLVQCFKVFWRVASISKFLLYFCFGHQMLSTNSSLSVMLLYGRFSQQTSTQTTHIGQCIRTIYVLQYISNVLSDMTNLHRCYCYYYLLLMLMGMLMHAFSTQTSNEWMDGCTQENRTRKAHIHTDAWLYYN